MDGVCYRQLSLDPKHVWVLGAKLQLDEAISSWTTSLQVAESFKGGVPPPGWQGVIIETNPEPKAVVANLSALFDSPEFVDAVDREKPNVIGYHDGIGKYGATQQEVVLELPTIPLAWVSAAGGCSSTKEELARLFFGREPSADDIRDFDARLAQSSKTLGPVWLRGPGMARALATMVKFVEKNAHRHAEP